MSSKISVFVAVALAIVFTWGCKSEGGGFNGLTNETDSASYAIGMDMGKNLQDQDILLNPDALAQGIKDASSGEGKFTEDQIRDIIMSFQQNAQKNQQSKSDAKGQENLAKGLQFLEQKKTEEGVTAHESGLAYKVLTPGTGKSPTLSDQVKIHYRGTLIDGTEFDSSYKRGQPATFPLANLIKGWQIAMPLMKEGGKWEIYVPQELAYGPQAPPNIGPNQALVFEIELFEVVPAGEEGVQ